MAYTYSQKQTILQKIFSKITKEFRFCKEDKDFDSLMEKYAVSLSEENTVIVSRNLRYSGKYSDIILGSSLHTMKRIDEKNSLLQAIKENLT